MSKRKIICLVTSLLMLVSMCTVCAVSASASESKTTENRGEIDVWFIAGQSNAVGFGSDGLSAGHLTDKRFTEGFENVLFYGKYESTYNPTEFVPVTVGLGKQTSTNTTTSGAEIGIASALGDGSRMNAVIKRAVGASYLYPTTNGSVAQNSGTWTPPSYLEKYGVDTETNKIGDIYTSFLETAKSGIEMLIADGYTPVYKGIWWMQGEAESDNVAYANAYEELLSTLISDMRRDLGEIANADLSKLPFVCGKITRNPDPAYSQPAYIDVINNAQLTVTSSVENVFIVDTTGLKQLDGWHYSADSQLYIGEQFVNTVIASEGKFNVIMNGQNATMTGGGAKAAGESVTVGFSAYEGCTLQSVTMTVGSGESVNITLDADNSYTFTMPEDAVVFNVVSIDPGAINTQYGVIPSKFKDSEKYPFILFKNGELLHAYENWNSFANGSSVNGATLLMTRNYNTSEDKEHAWGICYIKNVTIDLNGNTLTRGDYHLFQALGKGSDSHYSKFTITNGTLKTSLLKSDGKGASPLFVFNNDAASTTKDNFEFILDGITLDVSSGRGIVDCYGDGTVGSNAKIVLNNCTIDRGESTSSITLFGLADTSGNKNDIEIVINGGKLVTDTLSGLTFAKYSPERDSGEGSPDKASVDENFKVLLPESYTYSGTMFAFTNGNYALKNPVADSESDNLIYSLAKPDTPYGNIPENYASAEDYPFILFKNGEAKFATNDWHNLIIKTIYGTADYQTGCTILLRRDYSTSEATSSPWALSYIKDITIDLGGHTFTRGNNHLFQASSHGKAANNITITVTNGTLKTQFYKDNSTSPATPIIVFNTDGGATVSDNFNFIFDGVTFNVSSGRGIIDTYGDGSVGTSGTVTLNNCTIYRGTSTSTMTLFNLQDSKGNKNDTTVIINGGKIIGNSLTGLAFATYSAQRESGKGSPDTLTIGNAADGSAFRAVLPTSYTHTGTLYTLTVGSYYLVKTSENASDSTANYTFFDPSTKYGNIPYDYVSAEDYPFVLFKNGEGKFATNDWHNLIIKTIYGTADYQTGCTILLRRDYSTSEATSSPWALSYIKDITIDLGGHTFTRGNNHLFQASSHGKAANNITITVTNGTLKTQFYKDNSTSPATPIIVFNTDGGATVSDNFNFIFDGVTFNVSSGRGIIDTYGDGSVGTSGTVTLNNCTIYRANSTSAMTLFNLQDSKGNKNDTTVIINGGNLAADSVSGLTFAKFSAERDSGTGSPDSFVFGTNENGKYFTITIKATSTAPSVNNVWNTAGGAECVFVRASESNSRVTYALYPKVMMGYTVKTSVTLWSNLVYNIYIPKAGVASFTVNGSAPEFTETTIDGEIYYHVAVNLAAGNSLSDISLQVNLYSGSTTVDAKWTLNTLSYAKKVLEDETTDEVSEKVMKDMLAYALSAHTYFGNTSDTKKLEEAKALITSYSAPIPTGTAKTPTSTKYLTSSVVYLGAVPSFRFYLAEGYTAEDFSFKVGNKTVNAIASEDGKYVEIVVYAYMMLDDVTYTVTDKDSNNTVSESWNMFAYYEYAKTLGNANLTAIVEGLMKYSASAKNYKFS